MTFSNLLNPQASKILAYKAVSSEQVKALEPIAAKSENCTMYQLMARAGEAAFMVLMRHWPNAQKILVVAGNGNNAGDAYIVATLAHQSGKDVWVICEDPARKLPGDGGIAQANWQQVSSNTCRFDQVQFSQFEVIVDGLLGTGVNGDVKALFQEQILKINRAELPVLSLDLPSGMLANTGIALPVCVEADITITFIAPKPGFVNGHWQTI
ncbi:NAD(P)H-hydrate epimerase [Paraglaciecola aquimarina]|uniref:NAD(P)H-hydrate epimerase n=1 Tax=Paraglaciecola aquimarina TaxID=1235557 RepID=A0ABU3SUD6_9ALTE|nr:NAD(P)H-hydrate epimerase [Paraglaciecola aquimarina]MDU0353614.1 NAD(P)H-hydrate epimerase [Paraglaciecola aquimarina]